MLETLSIRPVLADLSVGSDNRAVQVISRKGRLPKDGILRGHTPDTTLSRRVVKIWSSPVATRRIRNGPKVAKFLVG